MEEHYMGRAAAGEAAAAMSASPSGGIPDGLSYAALGTLGTAAQGQSRPYFDSYQQLQWQPPPPPPQPAQFGYPHEAPYYGDDMHYNSQPEAGYGGRTESGYFAGPSFAAPPPPQPPPSQYGGGPDWGQLPVSRGWPSPAGAGVPYYPPSTGQELYPEYAPAAYPAYAGYGREAYPDTPALGAAGAAARLGAAMAGYAPEPWHPAAGAGTSRYHPPPAYAPPPPGPDVYERARLDPRGGDAWSDTRATGRGGASSRVAAAAEDTVPFPRGPVLPLGSSLGTFEAASAGFQQQLRGAPAGWPAGGGPERRAQPPQAYGGSMAPGGDAVRALTEQTWRQYNLVFGAAS